jgi:hypothetical protein
MQIVHLRALVLTTITYNIVVILFHFPDGRDGSTCQAACLNGGSCSGSKCVCRPGYQGEFCGERKFLVSLLSLIIIVLILIGILLQLNIKIPGFKFFNTQNDRKCEME